MLFAKEYVIKPSVVYGVLLLSVFCATTRGGAQNDDSDLTDDILTMALEELMAIEFGEYNPLEIHHTHNKGEFMLGYSSRWMGMEENRDGRSRLSTADVLGNFMVAPTSMLMNMQMVGMMYGYTEHTTLMVMMPYVIKSMKHVNRMGVEFETKSDGLGDLKVSALHTIFRNDQHLVYISGGVSVPTGSISVQDTTPTGLQRLPYPMQLGSGTYDVLPGIAYLGQVDPWAWGAHASGVIRLGRNSREYRLGNEFQGTVWLTRRWSDRLSTHLRLDSKAWRDIHGADPGLNPAMVPTADPDRRGGHRTDIGFGLNLRDTQGRVENGRFSVEYAVPVYQSLHGPQLATDWIVSVGWRVIF